MPRHEVGRAMVAERRLVSPLGSGDIQKMKTSLDHLPAGKRRELAYVVEILTSSFAEAVSGRKADRLKNGKILKIILFGSYARGDWVEDPVGRYFSDYDLLVVVDDEDLADTIEFWDIAEARLLKELSAGKNLRTPVNFIVHSLQDVNYQLEHGRYFFVDIVRDGILLQDTPGNQLAIPAELSLGTALKEARAYFEDWIGSADEFLELAEFSRGRGFTKKAAFLLHQGTEHLYNCVLLVLTLYTPKSHNLVRLRNLAEPLDLRLATIWPTDTKFEKRCFELLRAAYVKARYSRHYRITADELAWLTERTATLKAAVRAVCEAQLAALELRAAAE